MSRPMSYEGREIEKRTLVVRILNSVPKAGVEPARIAPLVFETSASTDSAIWASLRCKFTNNFSLRQIYFLSSWVYPVVTLPYSPFLMPFHVDDDMDHL